MTEVLRAGVAAWLRYEKQISLVAFERGICSGVPDICAVSKDRFLMEVEIKVSMSDFKRDKLKWKWKYRSQDEGYQWGTRIPAYFWYAVPPAMVEAVKKKLGDGQGLLTLEDVDRVNSLTGIPSICAVVPAKKNKAANKLDFHSILRMVKHQTGTLVGLACNAAARDFEKLTAAGRDGRGG